MNDGPETYRAWTRLIDTFAEGNDTVISVMKNGHLHLNQEVASRFTNRWIKAIQKRVDLMAKKFNLQVEHSQTEGDVVENLLSVRKEYNKILSAIDLPVFTEQMHSQLMNLVIDSAKKTQQSLERNAKSYPVILNLIKENPIYKD